MIALLNDILESKDGDRIKDVYHLNPFNYRIFEGDKLSILDIKARTDRDEIINIEVQVRKEDNFRRRSLFYWAKAYSSTISESEGYDNLEKTIVINILDYIEISESQDYHSRFKIYESNHKFILLDDLEIHYLELPKLDEKEVDELEGTELWLEFLKGANKEEFDGRLNKIIERSEIMAEAMDKLKEISADERMREMYLAREKYRLDMVSKLKYAERKGREEGIEEGREEGREEGIRIGRVNTVKRLLNKKLGELPTEIINKIDELDIANLDIITDDIFDINCLDDINKYL